MPLYDWKCKHCDQAVGVLRTFEEYEKPPTNEEAKPECAPENEHTWERIISAPRFIHGASWRGSKGNW